MTPRHLRKAAGLGLAAISAAAMIGDATLASAQPDQGYGNSGQYDNSGRGDDSGPPQGQYAPPPPGYDDQGGATYDDRSQQTDQDYGQRYAAWADQNCIDRRNNNTAAGAIIGGVLGAVVGSSIAGRRDRGGGAIVGGALGAGTGAAIGSSSSGGGGCPPGYLVRGGAPAFAYGGYGPGVVYAGPSWYNPWVWAGGRWAYRPYRSWYWNHRSYWRPGWRGRPWRRRW